MKLGDDVAVIALALLWFGSAGADHHDADPVAARERVLDAFEKHGYPRSEAAFAVYLESGWNPHARGNGAAGLIQFRPFVLRALRYPGSPRDFSRLSIDEQLPWIARYLDAVARTNKHWGKPGDTYVLLAGPDFLGSPDATVMYRRGSDAARSNPTLQDSTGQITAGSVRARLLSVMGQEVPADAPTPGSLHL